MYVVFARDVMIERQYVFNDNEKEKAIEKYEDLQYQVHTSYYTPQIFPTFRTVQLFEYIPYIERGERYIKYKPIRKYKNGKWINTKFYNKKFHR